jgi:hypothetical protein
VHHLLNRRALEQIGQQIIALVVAMEMEVHVLMHCRQFIGNGFVEQLDAFFVFHGFLQ